MSLHTNNLVGFGGGGAVYSVSYVDETHDEGDNTPPIPSLAAADDLCILIAFGDAVPFTSLTYNYPSGWTIISSELDGERQHVLTYKILESGDLGTSLPALWSGSINEIGHVMFCFRGDKPIKSINLSSWNFEDTAGDPAAQTVTTTSAKIPHIVIGGITSNDGTSGGFTTETPAFDFTESSYVGVLDYHLCWLGYKIYNPTDTRANHTVDVGDTGADTALTSGYIECVM